MFRDTYKAANNDIIPDSEFFAQTLSRLENSKKKKVVSFRVIGSCAAALLIAAGSVFGYMRIADVGQIKVAPDIVKVDTNLENAAKEDVTAHGYTEKTDDKEKDDGTAYVYGKTDFDDAQISDKTSETVSAPKKNNNIKQENNVQKSNRTDDSVPKEKTSSHDINSDIKTGNDVQSPVKIADEAPPVQMSENASVANTVEKSVPEAAIEANADCDDSEKAYETAETQMPSMAMESSQEWKAFDDSNAYLFADAELQQETEAASGGGGGAYCQAFSSVMTYDEYSNYLGADVFAEADVPDDMVPQRWESVDVNKTPSPDFEFKGDGRYVRINATVNYTEQRGHSVDFDGENFSGSVSSGEISYDINGSGLTKEEVDALKNSLEN